jgi:hypothetical protein
VRGDGVKRETGITKGREGHEGKAGKAGTKQSRLTVVVFTPPAMPGQIGICGMARDGLSERVP